VSGLRDLTSADRTTCVKMLATINRKKRRGRGKTKRKENYFLVAYEAMKAFSILKTKATFSSKT
jgi:hypothetical protein